MKLSVKQWFDALGSGIYYHVFLNGRDVTSGCIFADDDRGIVEHYKRDEHGQIMLMPLSDTPIVERQLGTVEIVKASRSDLERGDQNA